MPISPPCSRGGTVRRHSDDFAPSFPHNDSDFASVGSGLNTVPPDLNSCVSRASTSAIRSLLGSVVTTPGKLAFGIRMPGSASLTASIATVEDDTLAGVRFGDHRDIRVEAVHQEILRSPITPRPKLETKPPNLSGQ